jgi:ATP-dependent DNA helicase DinG
MPKFDWTGYFPYSEIRPGQKLAIDAIIDAFESGKKYFVLEAGTGVGKSAIGITVSRYVEKHIRKSPEANVGSYILTTQKILQEQYIKDHSGSKGSLCSIKSSSNYMCKHHKMQSCGESLRLLQGAQKGSAFWNACISNCVYKKAKKQFIEGNLGVTNFSYFLAETQYAGKLEPRQLMIIDEAHNTPSELSKFIEVNVTEQFCKSFLGIELVGKLTQLQTIKWVKEVYMPKLETKVSHFEKNLERFTNLKEKIEAGEFASLAKKYELLDKHACKMRRFLKIWDNDNWVMDEQFSNEKNLRKIQFKPIDVAEYAPDMIHKFGDYCLFMSATILNESAFSQLLGIEKDDYSSIRIESPFPVENRPIIYSGIGKMSANEIQASLPKLKQAVKAILDGHKNEKGIIHCHSYKIAWYLKKNIRSKRLLIHDSSDRDEVLRKHINSKEPTVLLSPSMTEGVDLHGDLSRFQIICKVPFPYLGDKLIRKKMNKWKWWYDLQTAKTVIQSVGRSIRNEKDTAVTYILDSSWERFYNKNKSLFGPEFKI